MSRTLGMQGGARQLNLEGGTAAPDSSIDEAKAAARESGLESANALSDAGRCRLGGDEDPYNWSDGCSRQPAAPRTPPSRSEIRSSLPGPRWWLANSAGATQSSPWASVLCTSVRGRRALTSKMRQANVLGMAFGPTIFAPMSGAATQSSAILRSPLTRLSHFRGLR